MMTSANNPNKSVGKIRYEIFEQYLVYFAESYMKQQGNNARFVIDNNNKQVIEWLFHWINRSQAGPLDYDKGIFLCGKIGCGKTILMKAFCEVLMSASGFYIQYFQAPQLYAHYKKLGMESLKKCPLFIDELGREQLEIYVDGARVRPIEDLVALRYDFGATTFYTSNFKLETLSRGYDENGKKIGYGEYIGDRLKQMNNIIILPGDSRR